MALRGLIQILYQSYEWESCNWLKDWTRGGSNRKAFLSCILPHHPSSIKSSIGWISFKFSFMIEVQELSHISKLFFQSPTGVYWYKAHHDITLNTLTSSSHLLLSPFFLARCKELHKHQQKSFSPCGTVLLNLFLFPTPHNSCYSREWLLSPKRSGCSPLKFSPFISLDKIPKFLSSHNTKGKYSFISFW